MEKLEGSWKKHVNFKYLAGEDFGDTPFNLKVKGFTKEMVYNPKERKETEELVIYFEGMSKGIVLGNKINPKAITEYLNTENIAEWIGKTIPFYGKIDKRHGRVIRVKKDYSNVKV